MKKPPGMGGGEEGERYMRKWMMEHEMATTIIVSVLTTIVTRAILLAIG